MLSILPKMSIDRLLIALVLVAVAALWLVVAAFTMSERDYILERARDQLGVTVATLADFNELAGQAGEDGATASETATSAIWRALLQYPSASIWLEAGDGTVIGGQPPTDDAGEAIRVEEARQGFTAYAALPRDEALADWQRLIAQRAVIMAVVTLALLILAWFLARALRQRFAAEAALREHDALLSTVTRAAGELLGAHRFDDAITSVLELVGRTLRVDHAHLNQLQAESADGRIRPEIVHEWRPQGVESLMHNKLFEDASIIAHHPGALEAMEKGGMPRLSLDDIPADVREPYEQAGLQSFLLVPVFIDRRLWGFFSFVDTGAARREWNWAETDTLTVLADLTATAMDRERYVKQLADANRIVHNSPTILYRLRGEPDFPLIYISHNIEKYGYQASALVGDAQWLDRLVFEEDGDKLREALGQMLDPEAKAATIEFRLCTGDGEVRWVENRYTPVRDEAGRLVEVEGIVIDITERKEAEEKIAAMARTDALTGLANRATFNERLEQEFAAARRGATPFAVFYLDLDHFKPVNDTHGHAIGDELLKVAAERLTAATRKSDLVARLGGDEFAVLQTEMHEPANATVLARVINEQLSRPFRIEGNDLRVSASIGICPYTEDSESPGNMLIQADLALYRAKEDGRNCYRFHSQELDDRVLERARLGDELRVALANDELELCYRPHISVHEESVRGVDVQVRWRHSDHGRLEGEQFLQTAEETGAIMALGYWIMDRGCAQLSQWRAQGISLACITFKLTATQLKSRDRLIADISEVTGKWELAPADIEFDVTEAMLAQATLSQNTVLAELRNLGYKVAIDNFGTQYSTFDYLRSYDVSYIRLSRAFLHDAASDRALSGSLQAILRLAEELDLGIIIQGLEREDRDKLLTPLLETARPRAVFYSYSKAMTPEETEHLLPATGTMKR